MGKGGGEASRRKGDRQTCKSHPWKLIRFKEVVEDRDSQKSKAWHRIILMGSDWCFLFLSLCAPDLCLVNSKITRFPLWLFNIQSLNVFKFSPQDFWIMVLYSLDKTCHLKSEAVSSSNSFFFQYNIFCVRCLTVNTSVVQGHVRRK